MELKITVDKELGEFSGKMSQQTYNNLPYKKRPDLRNNAFDIGELERDCVRIDVCDDDHLEHNTLYVSPYAKSLYYIDKEKLTLE